MTYKVLITHDQMTAIEETLLPCERNDWGVDESLLDWCEYHFYADDSWFSLSSSMSGYHYEFVSRWEAIMFKLRWG